MRTFLPSAKPLCGTKHGSNVNNVASTTLDEPIITNNLDEQQQRSIEENKTARRLSQTLAIAKAHSDYRFKPLSVDELFRKIVDQPLTTWPTGREATTSDDIAK